MTWQGGSAYWSSDQAVLFNTGVLAGLHSLEAESVHCVISSPPYLGLRNYATPPQVWGGEPGCQHVFQEDRQYKDSPVRSGNEGVGFHEPNITKEQRWSLGGVCIHCAAWQGHLGLEPLHDCLAWTRGEPPCPVCYICHIRTVFFEIWRVLRADGTVWWNVADSYNGSGGAGGDYRPGGLREGQSGYPGRKFPHLRPKNLTGVPWRTALALQADGWTLRSDIIWSKPNCMPQSVRDRPTSSHEHLFLLAKSPRYYYDQEAIREPHTSLSVTAARGNLRRSSSRYLARPDMAGKGRSRLEYFAQGGRNRRDVWTITTHPYLGAHFATFPPKLVEPCILAGTSEKGCCTTCGAPWQRMVERGAALFGWQQSCGGDATGSYRGEARKAYTSHGVQDASAVKDRILAGMTERLTTGWQPGCSCGISEVVPCTVLDPFAGSGTAGAVALQHGRRFIGIELNRSYCDLAVKRISESLRAEQKAAQSRKPRSNNKSRSPQEAGAAFPGHPHPVTGHRKLQCSPVPYPQTDVHPDRNSRGCATQAELHGRKGIHD